MIDHVASIILEVQVMALEGTWFGQQWQDLLSAVADKRAFDILVNPYIAAISLFLLVMGAYSGKKGIFLGVIATWGYTSVYHFTIGTKEAGHVMFDFETQNVSDVGILGTFGLGFVIVTGILIYFGFIKGE
jgi:hypothetical protein